MYLANRKIPVISSEALCDVGEGRGFKAAQLMVHSALLSACDSKVICAQTVPGRVS